MLLLPLRGWVLVLLVLLGGCQRATYSFQAAGAGPLAAPAPAGARPPDAPLPPAASWPAEAARRQYVGHPQRPRAAGRAKAAPAADAPSRRLQLLAVARGAVAKEPARQQPLPTGEPVRRRTRGIALLLAAVPLLVAIPLGLHYFYLGYYGRGVLTLVLAAVAFVLIAIGAIGAFVGLFFGASSGMSALLLIGTVLYSALLLLQLVDIIRIITGKLLPKDGEYYPHFFQTQPAAVRPEP